jgi:Gpi18-like mannosyltransferase
MLFLSEKISGLFDSINQRFISLFAKLDTFSNKKIYFSLFLMTFIFASPMILAYELEDNTTRFEHKDLHIFQDRAETILEGDLLYRDTEHVTLSPPLINYLFVPAVLLGDTPLIWTLWFSVFVFTSSVLLYKILSSSFEKRFAIAGSVFYLASPFSQYTTIMMMQDDAITVTFLLLAFLFILRKSWYKASVVFGLGAMTKLFPALCAPLATIGPRFWKKRLIAISIGLGLGRWLHYHFYYMRPMSFCNF